MRPTEHTANVCNIKKNTQRRKILRYKIFQEFQIYYHETFGAFEKSIHFTLYKKKYRECKKRYQS